jgi:lipid-A-disaccharide synthase-like uncharacterized protein
MSFDALNLADLAGWTGAGLVLFGFWRTSNGSWSGKSFWYEMDNLAGSSLLVLYALSRKSYVSLVLNLVWAIAAVRGLSSIAEREVKRKKRKR